MVDGKLHALTVLDDIGTAIADVTHDKFVSIECGSHGGGSHATVLGDLPILPYICVCGVDGEEQPGADGTSPLAMPPMPSHTTKIPSDSS
jgi:hypothetical protein